MAEIHYGKGCPGQGFRGGAVGYHDGAWHIMYGNYGQAGLFSRFRRRKPEVRIEGTTLGPAEAAAPSGTPPITAEMVAAKASRR